MTSKKKHTAKVLIPFKVGSGKKQKIYKAGDDYITEHKGNIELLTSQKRIK